MSQYWKISVAAKHELKADTSVIFIFVNKFIISAHLENMDYDPVIWCVFFQLDVFQLLSRFYRCSFTFGKKIRPPKCSSAHVESSLNNHAEKVLL